VICGTCGCDNASHLVFCQECGQRLGPRVAAPTPPIGVGAVPVAPAPAPAPVVPAGVVCARCGTNNQAGIRYCVTCGNALSSMKSQPAFKATEPINAVTAKIEATRTHTDPMAPPVLAAAAQPSPAAVAVASVPVPSPSPAPVTPIAIPRVAASAAPRVSPNAGVPVAVPPPAGAAAEGARVCPRCHGTSDDSAQFCRFCGAALGGVKPTLNDPPLNAPVAVGRATAMVGDANAGAFWRPPVPIGFPAPVAGAPVVAPSGPPPPVPVAAPPAPKAARGSGQLGAVEAPRANATPLVPPATDVPQARPTGAPPATSAVLGRIVVITKEGGEGASYPLREQLDIGRSQGDVTIADDQYLSPRHARIARRADAASPGKAPFFALVDLASTNGVYLRLNKDGSREVPLEDQDLFLVGQQVLKFETVRDAEEGLAPATQHGTLVFGTPATRRYARISQRSVEGVTRDVFHVQKAETVIGRESGDIVFTDDPFLSRRHAAIKFEHTSRRFVLADLGSSNGTFIQIRGEVTIKSGDQFRIGQQLFRVDLSAAPAP